MTTYTVILAIGTSSTALPAGSAAVGSLQVELLDATGAVAAKQDIASAANPTVSFSTVAEGTYTATATQLDVNGVAIGAPISAQVVVPAPVVPPVMFDAPTGITATVLAE